MLLLLHRLHPALPVDTFNFDGGTSLGTAVASGTTDSSLLASELCPEPLLHIEVNLADVNAQLQHDTTEDLIFRVDNGKLAVLDDLLDENGKPKKKAAGSYVSGLDCSSWLPGDLVLSTVGAGFKLTLAGKASFLRTTFSVDLGEVGGTPLFLDATDNALVKGDGISWAWPGLRISLNK